MHLTLLLFFLCLFISSSAFLTRTNRFDGFGEEKASFVADATESDAKVVEADLQNGDEDLEDLDFRDDDSEDLIKLFDTNEQNVQSVTHLHKKQGEILVPCFGMWWPVGGYTYEYQDDYTDEGKKKRRRSRKQKKSARAKKKKS